LAVAKGEIWSVQQLASRCAWVFHICVSTLNTVVPKRSSHPIIFLLASCSLGISFIWLGSQIDENYLLYLLLNFILVYPGLHYYAVLSTIWHYMKPYFDMLEAEFDRGQIESPSERDKEEREFWEPIVNSPDFNNHAIKAFPSELESWKPSPSHTHQPDDWSDSSLEADSSEAQFLRSLRRFHIFLVSCDAAILFDPRGLVPKRMQVSTLKNKLTIDAITKDLLSANPSQADIDDWFSEVTGDPTPRHRRDDSSDFEEDFDHNDSPLSSPLQTEDISGQEEDSGFVMVP
uniref:RGS domain-containing protein n=1 Tax=Schistocephalus solidus TaxID=70667 RepID=A0A183T7J8_SCHSO